MSEQLALLSFHVLVYSSHLKVTVIANIKSMLRMVSGSRWVGCSACARLLYTYYISKWLHDDVRLLSHSSIVISSKWPQLIVPVAALHDSESLLSNMNLCKGPKVAKMHNLLHVPYAIKLRSTSGLHKLRYKSTFVCKEEVSVTGSKLLFSWSSTFSWDDPLLVQT